MNRHVRYAWALLGVAVTVGIAVTGLLLWTVEGFAQAPRVAAAALDGTQVGWGFLAAALSTGLAALGAAYAVGHVGAAAIGAITEKPEMFGRAMILVGLAEGIAIYGIIISILILNRLAP